MVLFESHLTGSYKGSHKNSYHRKRMLLIATLVEAITAENAYHLQGCQINLHSKMRLHELFAALSEQKDAEIQL